MGNKALLTAAGLFQLVVCLLLLQGLNAYTLPLSSEASSRRWQWRPHARGESCFTIDRKLERSASAILRSTKGGYAPGRSASPLFGASVQVSDPSGNASTQLSWKNLRSFASKHFFLLGMLVAVALARAFPALGADGGVLRPELVLGRWGVSLIFLLSGLSLEVSQLAQAMSNVRLNAAVQLASFAVWPLLVGWPLRRLLPWCAPGLFPPELLDGLLVMSTLPTTVNMCVILTGSAGGDGKCVCCGVELRVHPSTAFGHPSHFHSLIPAPALR